MWPVAALGALAVNLTTDLSIGTAAGIAAGNTAAAVAGALVLRKSQFEPALLRTRDVLTLAFLGGGAATVISATIGTVALILGGVAPSADALGIWTDWWLGDTLGVIVFAPLILS